MLPPNTPKAPAAMPGRVPMGMAQPRQMRPPMGAMRPMSNPAAPRQFGRAQPVQQANFRPAARPGMVSSDEHSKERIRELEDLNDRYKSLVDGDPHATAGAHAPASSSTYRYKDPKAPGAAPGTQTGPMAQELEGIPGVVKDTPRGKMVDPQRLTMANTSAIGDQERRMQALEQRYGALSEEDTPAAYNASDPIAEYRKQRYGMPVIGQDDGGAASEEEGSFMDRILGPTVGQQAADITNEEYRNAELKRRFRKPDREDTAL